jgi:hypothetical protein
MKIVKATYGTNDVVKDVTEDVKKFFINEQLTILVSNKIFEDPQIGFIKYLNVEFENGLKISQEEGNYLLYPEFNERVGIFYSNNYESDLIRTKSLNASLESLKLSSKQNVRIVTSVWNAVPNNPFIELFSPIKVSCHLNQVLQILQCLYFIRKNTNKVKYVSFLEHDCIYPEDYFNYDDFECDSITNTNHIGLSKDGWQPKNHGIRPTSNIIMKFDRSIEHFENILPHALFNNSGSLEPWYSKNEGRISLDWTNEDWECKNPSFHINHGHNFTQHFTTFKKIFSESNDYWGHYSEYSDLFS